MQSTILYGSLHDPHSDLRTPMEIQYGDREEHTLQQVTPSTQYPLLRICFPFPPAFYKYMDIFTLFLHSYIIDIS